MIQRLSSLRLVFLVIPFLLCVILIQIEASWISHAPSFSRKPVILRGGGSETLAGEDEKESNVDEDTVRSIEQIEDSREGQETTTEVNDSNVVEEPDVQVIHSDTSLASEPSPSESMPAILETTTTTVLHHTEDSSTLDHPTVAPSAETETDSPAFSKEALATAMDRATQLRASGKSLHDRKKFKKAASRFSEAAQALLPFLEASSSSEEEEDDNRIIDEYATCRLHESLCQLKCENFEEAKTACAAVLDLVESESTGATPALRARAFYRRAKAELELGDTAAALQDARSAAFLGDSKAVALYGKLMRESSSGSSEMLDLSGSNALLESLLNKSSNEMPASPVGDIKDMLTSSLLSNMMGSTSGANNEGGVGSLAKSVLSSLSKRMDKDETQEQICSVLQNTSGPQLRQMAGMAGFQLDEFQASKLAAVCKGVTPKLLRRLLKTTKILIYAGRIVQKTFALLSKYRTVIMILFIAAWAKSALLRPLPVSKRARRLAQQAFSAVP